LIQNLLKVEEKKLLRIDTDNPFSFRVKVG